MTPEIQQAIAFLKAHPNTQMATVEGDEPWVRAMYVLRVDDDGSLWFSTWRDSAKIRQLQANAKVCLAAYEGMENVRVFGTAAMVDDKATRDAFWSPMMAEYFSSVDDPQFVLLKITPTRAETQFSKQKA